MHDSNYYFLPCAIYIITANGNTDISLEIYFQVGGIVSFHFNTLAMYGFCLYCLVMTFHVSTVYEKR